MSTQNWPKRGGILFNVDGIPSRSNYPITHTRYSCLSLDNQRLMWCYQHCTKWPLVLEDLSDSSAFALFFVDSYKRRNIKNLNSNSKLLRSWNVEIIILCWRNFLVGCGSVIIDSFLSVGFVNEIGFKLWRIVAVSLAAAICNDFSFSLVAILKYYGETFLLAACCNMCWCFFLSFTSMVLGFIYGL